MTVSIFGALSEILSHTTESLSFLTSSTTESVPLAHTHHTIINKNDFKNTPYAPTTFATTSTTTAQTTISDPFDDLTISLNQNFNDDDDDVDVDKFGLSSSTTSNLNDKLKLFDAQVQKIINDTSMTMTLNETKLIKSNIDDIDNLTIDSINFNYTNDNLSKRDNNARSIDILSQNAHNAFEIPSQIPLIQTTLSPLLMGTTTDIDTSTLFDAHSIINKQNVSVDSIKTNNATISNYTHMNNDTNLTQTANVIIITAQTIPTTLIDTTTEPLTTTHAPIINDKTTINNTDVGDEQMTTTENTEQPETTTLTVSIFSPISNHSVPLNSDMTIANKNDPLVTNIDLMTSRFTNKEHIELPRPVYVHETTTKIIQTTIMSKKNANIPTATTNKIDTLTLSATPAYKPRFVERIPIFSIGFYANTNQRLMNSQLTAANPLLNESSTTILPMNETSTIHSSLYENVTTHSPANVSSTTKFTSQQITTTSSTASSVDKNIGQAITTRKSRRFDFVIYGILPNKTVIRKYPDDIFDDTPEDNTDYIYGILKNNSVIKKYSNGTTVLDDKQNSRKFEVTNIDVNKLLNPHSDIYQTESYKFLKKNINSTTDKHGFMLNNNKTDSIDNLMAINKTNFNCTNFTDTNCIKNMTNSLQTTFNTVNSTSDNSMVFKLPFKEII